MTLAKKTTWYAISGSLLIKLILVTMLVLLSDWLFFKQSAGWTIGGFSLLVLMALILLRPAVLKGRGAKLLLAVNISLCCLLVEDPNMLGLALAWVGISLQTLWPRFSKALAANIMARAIGRQFLSSAHAPFTHMQAASRARNNRTRMGTRTNIMRVVAMPLLLSLLFLMLFATANSVMADLLEYLMPWQIIRYISFGRLFFWCGMLLLIWPILRPYFKAKTQKPQSARPTDHIMLSHFFSAASVLLALVLCNVLFLLQNIMDIFQISAGQAVPSRITNFDFAHRGAYTLILAALLSAAFILLVWRTSFRAQISGNIRALTYAWLMQNVILVGSCAYRLNLYTQTHSLTSLRFSTFIWMALVATGLILIACRITYDKSSRWLINANALAAAATLYICSAISFPAIVSGYNARHYAILTQPGHGFYVCEFTYQGAETLPALSWLLQQPIDAALRQQLTDIKQALYAELQQDVGNWRGWTWRAARLRRAMDTLAPSWRTEAQSVAKFDKFPCSVRD
jgi:Domain of unknown function (DUF4173)